MGRFPFDLPCRCVFLLQHHARFSVLFLCVAAPAFSYPFSFPFPKTTSERTAVYLPDKNAAGRLPTFYFQLLVVRRNYWKRMWEKPLTQ